MAKDRGVRHGPDTFEDLGRDPFWVHDLDVQEFMDATNECSHGHMPWDRNIKPECRCWQHILSDPSYQTWLKAREAARRL